MRDMILYPKDFSRKVNNIADLGSGFGMNRVYFLRGSIKTSKVFILHQNIGEIQLAPYCVRIEFFLNVYSFMFVLIARSVFFGYSLAVCWQHFTDRVFLLFLVRILRIFTWNHLGIFVRSIKRHFAFYVTSKVGLVYTLKSSDRGRQ